MVFRGCFAWNGRGMWLAEKLVSWGSLRENGLGLRLEGQKGLKVEGFVRLVEDRTSDLNPPDPRVVQDLLKRPVRWQRKAQGHLKLIALLVLYF